MFIWKQVTLNIVINELHFIWLKHVHFPALHRTKLMCTALYCTALMQELFFYALWSNSERDFWRCYGKFAKLAFEMHRSTELGFLRVRKTPHRKLLRCYEACAASFKTLNSAIFENLRSCLLRRNGKPTKWSSSRAEARDFETRKASFCDVIENPQSGA